ncbi:bile acid:sodium symporter family protein [Alphaproteobacteria bacterium]|jgi:BASS family bile acid:Na+ symporter|nr:bile acid:sodium symporter family protein [Alphaproteobacteria bacterium]MDB3974327.1 bile acid:sodium symporter family protein [Alphaproteobacteria bacterium]MDC0968357.1 bile acid:sodium symporter family protein [Alphaproteobacteria bacterium]
MNVITDVILPLALAFIMFTLGLGLTFSDFARVAKMPKNFLVGLVSQLVFLPLVALIIVFVWPLQPELAIGLILIAAAPGGVTSNILTSFAKGDVALSISLTAVMSLLSVVSVPLVLGISMGLISDNSLGSISLTSIAISMFLIVTLPVLLGMIFRASLSYLTKRIEKIAKIFSTALFVLVLIGAILAERQNLVEYFAQTGLVVLILNILMMTIAYYWAKLFSSGRPQLKAISLECGLQNGTLAIFVGTSVFGGGLYIVPAATYSVIMYLTSLIFIYFIRKR